jgi:hypothetical protein
MIEIQNRGELERKLERTKRLAAFAGDQMTVQRLTELAGELAESLRKFPTRRALVTEDHIRSRAHELWQQHGRPEGQDVEFWLRAECELIEGGNNS